MAQMNQQQILRQQQQQYQTFLSSSNTSNFPYANGNINFQNNYSQYNPLFSSSNTNLPVGTSAGTSKVQTSLLPNPVGWQPQHGSVTGSTSDNSSVILNRTNNFE